MRIYRHNLSVPIALAALMLAGGAHADMILDTGQGSNPPPAGLSLSTTQGIGVEFTLTGTYAITDIEAWLWEIREKSGDLTVTIYGDAGDIPDASNPIYQTTFPADGPGATEAEWTGPLNLDWRLGPGTYWATFQVLAPSDANFVAPNTATAPLTAYAVYNANTGSWQKSGSDRWGVRIQGIMQAGSDDDPTPDGDDDPIPDDGDDDPPAPAAPACGGAGSVMLAATSLFLWSVSRSRRLRFE